MVSINNLSVEFSAKPIFSDISFFINPADKIALIGKNGAGKSTLLKILSGLQTPTSGSVDKPENLSIGYLPQQMKIADDTTVMEETKKIFEERLKLEKELEEINSKINSYEDTESTDFFKLLEKADFLNNRIMSEPLSEIESETEKTLLGLGFKKTDFNRPTKEFSGGWRMRIELAKILLAKPDLLLLDEPTNHLDIESIQWLEKFLQTKGKAILLVSHDKAFLNNVTKRTVEISCGKIYDYKVSYSEFSNLRGERIAQQKAAFEKQQKEIEETKKFIERFRYKPSKASQVQSRIKQLEKIVPIEIDEVDNKTLRLKFPPVERSGDFPLIIENVGKKYDEHQVFDGVNLTLRRGDKVAFVGKNGEGKTTLVKCIMNDIGFGGSLKIGHNVKIGYFAQNQAQLLDETKTVFETIDYVATGDIRNRINDILGAFMFGGEASEKKVSVLSGGEKTRLAMIKLLLEPVNFLILDEPTNHLDMKTKEVLKEAIKNFTGTVILVSHDRDFLEGLVSKVYEFGNGKVTEHLGGVYEFLEKKNLENLSEIEKNKSKKTFSLPESDKDTDNDPQKKPGNLSYQEMKERDKELKRIETKIKKSEQLISELENRLKEIEDELSKGNASQEIIMQYDSINSQLENEMAAWEENQMLLDDKKKEFS